MSLTLNDLSCDQIERSDSPENNCGEIYAPDHSVKLLEGLQTLRSKKILCDVTLSAEGKKFSIHRDVLVSCSKYFETILGDQDQIKREVEVTDVSAVGLDKLIQFIYTSTLVCTNLTELTQILQGATRLQIASAVDVCCQYLLAEINDDSCVDVLNIATEFELDTVKCQTENYIIDNFLAVASGKGYQKLTCDQLVYFVSHERLSVAVELDLFQAVLSWLKHESDRQQFIKDVLSTIRFPLIQPNDVVDYVQSEDLIMDDLEVRSWVMEAMTYHVSPYRQHLMQTERTQVRGGHSLVLAVGGEQPKGSVSKEVRAFDEIHHQWKQLPIMPIQRLDHAVAVLDNFLYVVGGQYTGNSCGNDSIGTVHRYDPRFNMWLQMCPMEKRRALFTLNALNGRLYAVGGKNEYGVLASVECFDPENNCWTYIQPLALASYAHASTEYEGKLFISGGVITSRFFSDALLCYDPESGEWSQKTSMETPRGMHSMCAIRNKVYVAGGNGKDHNGRRVDILSVECYNPLIDEWSILAPLSIGLSMAGVTVRNNQMYIIGGYSGRQGQRRKSVHAYDTENNVWTVIGELPSPVIRLACCTLSVPPHLLQSQVFDGRDKTYTGSKFAPSMNVHQSIDDMLY
ncbi:kelch-like protein 26 [Glandiceps talaboti]